MLLRSLDGIGGTWSPTKHTIKGTPELLHRQFSELERFRLVTPLNSGRIESELAMLGDRFLNDWQITTKGVAVSHINVDQTPDPVPAHAVVPEPVNWVTEDGVVVNGQFIGAGTLIRLKGKKGTYKFLDTHVTSKDRVVLNLIGPVGMHQAFHAAYLEDVKLIPVAKPKRKYTKRVRT